MDTELVLDGNALAGLLHEALGRELTEARAACAACGAVLELGGQIAYAHAPGAVVRCRNCTSVLIVLVQGPGWYRVGVEKLRWLELGDGAAGA